MKRFNKKLVFGALGALMCALLPFQGANAASGTTSVTIDFPDIIILHYVSDLTLTFTGNELSVDEGEGSATDNLAAVAADFDADMPLTEGGVPDNVSVTVQNVWAVRGLTSSGNIRVTPEIDKDTAKNGSSEAVMSNLLVKTSTVSAGDPITIPAPGLGMSNAVYGDIVFNLDISGITVSGSHDGMQYTIEATAP